MILAFLFGKEVHMQVQDISLTQIVVVLLFLGALILLQQLLKNNKFNFQDRLNKKKRMILKIIYLQKMFLLRI